MSDHYIGVNRTGNDVNDDSEFTFGTSTGSTDIEVRIADAAGWTQSQVVRALQRIADRIATSYLSTFPDA